MFWNWTIGRVVTSSLIAIAMVGTLYPAISTKLDEKTSLSQASLAVKAVQQLQDLSPAELDSDWQLDEFFGHIKVISSRDSSRFPQLLERMKEVGLTEAQFELSPVIIGATLPESLWARVPFWATQDDTVKQKMAGCTLAHYHLIKNTKEKYQQALQNYAHLQSQPQTTILDLEAAKKEIDKYSSVLIIEDNNAFGSLRNGAPTLEGMGRIFRETLAQLPDDWDMFYFICMHGDYDLPPAEEVAGCPLLLKASYGLINKCFAVKATAYDRLVEQYEAYIAPQLGSEVVYWTGSSLATMTVTSESISRVELRPADHIVALLHKRLNVYIAKEPLSYRSASASLAGSASPGSGIILAEHHFQPRPH